MRKRQLSFGVTESLNHYWLSEDATVTLLGCYRCVERMNVLSRRYENITLWSETPLQSNRRGRLIDSPDWEQELLERGYLEYEWLLNRLRFVCKRVGFGPPIFESDAARQERITRAESNQSIEGMRLQVQGLRDLTCVILGKLSRSLLDEVYIRKELPRGWDGGLDYHELPLSPIRGRRDLLDYLRRFHQQVLHEGVNSFDVSNVMRELGNSRRFLRVLKDANSESFSFPISIESYDEADRTLASLVDWLEAKIHTAENPVISPPVRVKKGRPKKTDPDVQKLITKWDIKKYGTFEEFAKRWGIEPQNGKSGAERVKNELSRQRERNRQSRK